MEQSSSGEIKSFTASQQNPCIRSSVLNHINPVSILQACLPTYLLHGADQT
jgi:hypothetical protein